MTVTELLERRRRLAAVLGCNAGLIDCSVEDELFCVSALLTHDLPPVADIDATPIDRVAYYTERLAALREQEETVLALRRSVMLAANEEQGIPFEEIRKVAGISDGQLWKDMRRVRQVGSTDDR